MPVLQPHMEFAGEGSSVVHSIKGLAEQEGNLKMRSERNPRSFMRDQRANSK
jgi:hypothetical protein